MELIDKQAAIGASCTCHGGVHCNHYPCKDVQAIMDLPTIEAEPVRHGRWMWNGEYYCSECKGKSLRIKYAYCPHCGAKMGVDDGID